MTMMSPRAAVGGSRRLFGSRQFNRMVISSLASSTSVSTSASASASASASPHPLSTTTTTSSPYYHRHGQVHYSTVRYSTQSSVGLGSSLSKPRKKITIQTLRNLYEKGEPIAMITAHDFPSAHVADTAGMDMILVGDSLAMVALGMDDTSGVTLDDMILHCRSVARAANVSFVIADLPMGSFEVSPEQAVQSAIRIIKEGRVQAVKIEGGASFAPTIKRITTAGIPVVGHIGLTPQSQNALGGFRVQGKSVAGALKLLQDAYAVQEAGAFMVVLEAMPAEVAAIITKKLQIPTIGIGAGNGTSGQVLVQVDMSGNFPPGRFVPKFVKQYADVWAEAMRGMEQYRTEVKGRQFPSPDYTYPIPKEELEEFERAVEQQQSK